MSKICHIYYLYYETSFELYVFWPSDTERLINELRFSNSVSLYFKTRITAITCFVVMLHEEISNMAYLRQVLKHFGMTIEIVLIPDLCPLSYYMHL